MCIRDSLKLDAFGDRDPLPGRIDDEDRARQAPHLPDSAERELQLAQLLGEDGGFLLRQAIEVAVDLAGLELLEEAEALLDRHEVREHTAEPAARDVRLARALGLLDDRLLRLLLRADEEDLLAAGGGLADRVEGEVEALDRLGQVDDVDPIALREDERAHLGIPAAGLVAEVNAGLEELPHGDGGHGDGPPVRLFLRGPCSETGRRFRGPAPTRKRGLAPRVISPAMFSARRQSPGDPAAGAESTTGSGPGRVAAATARRAINRSLDGGGLAPDRRVATVAPGPRGPGGSEDPAAPHGCPRGHIIFGGVACPLGERPRRGWDVRGHAAPYPTGITADLPGQGSRRLRFRLRHLSLIHI